MRVHAFNPSSFDAEARHQESKVNQTSLFKGNQQMQTPQVGILQNHKDGLYLADSVNLCACVHAWHVYTHGVYEAYMRHICAHTVFKKSNENKAGMVVCACNPTSRRLRQEELQKQDNLVALPVIDMCVCMYELFSPI